MSQSHTVRLGSPDGKKHVLYVDVFGVDGGGYAAVLDPNAHAKVEMHGHGPTEAEAVADLVAAWMDKYRHKGTAA